MQLLQGQQQQYGMYQQQPSYQQTHFMIKSLQDRLEQYRTQQLKQIDEVLLNIKRFYYRERSYLLKCLVFAASQAQIDPYYKKMMAQLQDKDALASNLIKSLQRNLNWSTEFNINFMENQRQELLYVLQDEQITQLKLLFYLNVESGKANIQHIRDFYNYLQETQFQGLMLGTDESRRYGGGAIGASYLSRDDQFIIQQSLIADLGIFVMLAMMQIQLFTGYDLQKSDQAKHLTQQLFSNKDAFKALQADLLQEDRLSKANGPICLAFTQMSKIISSKRLSPEAPQLLKEIKADYLKVLGECNLIESFDRLLQGKVFSIDQLQTMRSSFRFIAKSWLNLAYAFFKDQHMTHEMVDTQKLGMQVIQDPKNLKIIWEQLDASKPTDKKICSDSLTLDMYEQILDAPVDNIGNFVRLLYGLTGKKYHPYASNCLKLLQNYKVEGPSSHTLLDEIIGWLCFNLEAMEDQHLIEDQVQSLSFAVSLFAKMVNQNANLFIQLNQQLRILIEEHEDGKVKFKFEQDHRSSYDNRFDFFRLERQSSFPFLSLLVHCLHAFFNVNFTYSRKPIILLTNALATIYDNFDIKRDMIRLFKQYQSSYNNTQLTFYFQKLAFEHEQRIGNYKATESFIKLMCKIFKDPHPQRCLEIKDAEKLDSSFLNEILHLIYQELMKNFFKWKFMDAGSFGSFAGRLFKLTNILLKKFIEIPDQYKAHLQQPLPQFDFLLEIISNCLNQIELNQIIISAFDLVQVDPSLHYSSNDFANKHWYEAVRNRQNSPKQLKNLSEMFSHALQCLNTLTELTYLNSDIQSHYQQQQVLNRNQHTSLKHFYIHRLHCVRNMTMQLLETSKLQMVPTSGYGSEVINQNNLLCTMAFYAQKNNDMYQNIVVTKIQAETIKFFTLVCKVWERHQAEHRRSSLYLFLTQGVFSKQQIQQGFISTFLEAIQIVHTPAALNYVSSFMDLLLICANSQPKFIELLLSVKQVQTRFIHAVKTFKILSQANDQNQNLFEQNMRFHIAHKFVILISLMSQSKLCVELVCNQELMQHFMDGIIQPVTLNKINQSFKLDGKLDFIRPVLSDDPHQEKQIIDCNNMQAQKVIDQCLSRATLVYFMKLLSMEYARDPHNRTVIQIIEKLFNSEKFLESPEFTADKRNLESLYSAVNNANTIIRDDTNERELALQSQFNAYAASFASIEKAVNLQQDQSGLYLEGLSGFQLYNKLQSTPLFQLFMSSDQFSSMEPGRLGAQLFISIDELNMKFVSEQYINQFFLNQIRSIMMEYNLALSDQHCNYMLSEAKKDFLLSIGSTSQRSIMRASAENGQANKVDPSQSALYILISENDHSIAKSEYSKLCREKLILVMIKMVHGLQRQLMLHSSNRVSDDQKLASEIQQQNYFMVKLSSSMIEYLTILLAVINSQQEGPQLPKGIQDKLRDLVTIDLLQSLPEMFRNSFSMISVAEQQARSEQTIQSETERLSANLFNNLTLQCFQICEFLKQQEQERDNNQMIEDDYRRFDQLEEKSVLTTLSHVVSQLQKDYQFETGINIMKQALNLVNTEAMVVFMKKEDNYPLRVVYQKFASPNITPEDSSLILQFLNTYAQNKKGAEHLYKENLLNNLNINHCIQQVNKQDLYMNYRNETRRNISHILWCQALLLIRTLNSHFLDGNSIDSGYLESICRFFHGASNRVLSVLYQGYQLQEGQSKTVYDHSSAPNQPIHVMSVALLEEIELLTACFSQLFRCADTWIKLNQLQYIDIKDQFLFSLTQLVIHCQNILPSSATEQHLEIITHQYLTTKQTTNIRTADATSQLTALQVKNETSLVKIYFNLCSSLLNCLLLDKRVDQSEQLIVTWDQQQLFERNISGVEQQTIFERQWLRLQQESSRSSHDIEPIIKIAFDTFMRAHEHMMLKWIKVWRSTDLDSMIKYSHNLLTHDQWVLEEYGGTSCVLASDEQATDVKCLLAASLNMGNKICCLLLEKVRDNLSDIRYQASSGSASLHERNVVYMANKVHDMLKRVSQENAIEGDKEAAKLIGDRQMKTLVDFTEKIKLNPSKYQHQFYDQMSYHN